jgi:hypothetical protein
MVCARRSGLQRWRAGRLDINCDDRVCSALFPVALLFVFDFFSSHGKRFVQVITVNIIVKREIVLVSLVYRFLAILPIRRLSVSICGSYVSY